MQCIVHIWGTIDRKGKHFMLRLFPLYSIEKQRSVEVFPSEDLLSQRLVVIGFPKFHMRTTLSNLRSGSDAMWTSIEIAQDMFDGFGKDCKDSGGSTSDLSLGEPLAAA